MSTYSEMSTAVAAYMVRYENELLFGCLVAALLLSVLVETGRPRRRQSRSQIRRRWPANFGLLVLDQVNVTWLTALSVVLIDWWGSGGSGGLIGYLGIGFAGSVLLAILVFEFVSYWFHRLLHTSPLLWRIHAIHHSDPEIDLTTTFRIHPLELLVIAPVSLPLILLLGFPPAAVVAYQLVRTAVLIFAHSNIVIPPRVDRALRWIVTTPDYHRSHHSTDRRFNDSNFAPLLPLYDYIFGTYRNKPYDELETMPVGLDYMARDRDMRLASLLLAPFRWKRVLRDSRWYGADLAAKSDPG